MHIDKKGKQDTAFKCIHLHLGEKHTQNMDLHLIFSFHSWSFKNVHNVIRSISGLLWNYDAMQQNKGSLNYHAFWAGLIKTQAPTCKHLCLPNGPGHSPTMILKILPLTGWEGGSQLQEGLQFKNSDGMERNVLESWLRKGEKAGKLAGRKELASS